MAFGQPFETGSQRTSPATAIVAAVLGLGVAGLAAVFVIKFFSSVPSGMPAGFTIAMVLAGIGAVLALVGAILLFARKLPGAWMVAIGALVALAAVIFLPVFLSAGIGTWFKGIFQFSDLISSMAAILVIVAPLAVIVALIPSTLNATGSSTAQQSW